MLNEIVLNPNGKVDARRLPDPFATLVTAADDDGATPRGGTT